MEKWNGSLSLNSEENDSDFMVLLWEGLQAGFWVWEQESLCYQHPSKVI